MVHFQKLYVQNMVLQRSWTCLGLTLKIGCWCCKVFPRELKHIWAWNQPTEVDDVALLKSNNTVVHVWKYSVLGQSPISAPLKLSENSPQVCSCISHIASGFMQYYVSFWTVETWNLKQSQISFVIAVMVPSCKLTFRCGKPTMYVDHQTLGFSLISHGFSTSLWSSLPQGIFPNLMVNSLFLLTTTIIKLL